MLHGIRTAQEEGLTLEQVKEQFALRKSSPYYYHNFYNSSREKSIDTHNKHIEILWGLLNGGSANPASASGPPAGEGISHGDHTH